MEFAEEDRQGQIVLGNNQFPLVEHIAHYSLFEYHPMVGITLFERQLRMPLGSNGLHGRLVLRLHV